MPLLSRLRPVALCLTLTALLAGCGNDPAQTGLLGQFRQLAASRLGPSAPPPSAAQIRANITPELRAQLGNPTLMIGTLENPPLASLLIGVQNNGTVTTFSTPDGVTFALERGVLVATRGLGFDLMSADAAQTRAALAAGGGSGAVRVHRYLDGENQTVIRSFVCDIARTAPGALRERCYGDGLQFDNSYRIGARGGIIASRQWIGPDRGHVVLETTGR